MYITEKYDINGLLTHYTQTINGYTILKYENFFFNNQNNKEEIKVFNELLTKSLNS